MLDKESSLRLNLLRFPLIVGVIFIHAYGSEVGVAGKVVGTHETNFWVDFVRDLISQSLARVAVPLFFLMSGYLFFLGFKYSFKNYQQKLQSRVHTLLIPFLFWNIFTLGVIALAQALPMTQAYFTGKNIPVAEFGIYDFFNAIFGLDRSPIAYQFWFIRDLMVLILLSPLIYAINQTKPLPIGCLVFLCWFVDAWAIYIPSVEAVLFFSAGAYLGNRRINIFALDKFGLYMLAAYIPLLILDAFKWDTALGLYIHKLGIVLGVATVLYLTRFLLTPSKLKERLLQLSAMSFFVYATHEPLMNIMRKVIFKSLNPHSALMILSIYFLVPIVVITITIWVYHFLFKISPQIVQFITGGRSTSTLTMMQNQLPTQTVPTISVNKI